MADFSDVSEGECLKQEKTAGCELNASHTLVLQSVINEIKAHGRSSMHKEVCGVLLGNLCYDQEPYLLVDARIEGKYASHQSGSVTFTSETWDYINAEREEKFPDKKIVGWYHTHPGFGIFLSNMDAFIHNNFFSLKWQPAYVFDPQAETDGFFFSSNDNLVQEEVTIVPDEPPDAVTPRMAARASGAEVLTEGEESRQATRRFSIVMLLAVVILALAANVFGYLIFSEKLTKSQQKVEEGAKCVRVLSDQVCVQRNASESQQSKIALLERSLADAKRERENCEQKIREKDATIMKLEAEISGLQVTRAPEVKAESKSEAEPKAEPRETPDGPWYGFLIFW